VLSRRQGGPIKTPSTPLGRFQYPDSEPAPIFQTVSESVFCKLHPDEVLKIRLWDFVTPVTTFLPSLVDNISYLSR
jgi:hypothetical protein